MHQFIFLFTFSLLVKVLESLFPFCLLQWPAQSGHLLCFQLSFIPVPSVWLILLDGRLVISFKEPIVSCEGLLYLGNIIAF